MYVVIIDTADNSKSNGSATATGSLVTDDNLVSTSSSHSSSVSTAYPQLSKITAYEFMQTWNGLKGTTGIEPYVNILDQIQPTDIAKGTCYVRSV